MPTDEYKNFYTSLKEIGLTNQEAETYLASLRAGPTSISTLAKSLGISRPNVYKVIDSLGKKGLARFSEKGKYSKSFVVEPPDVVLERLRERRKVLSILDGTLAGDLPELLSQYQQGGGETKIKVFKGKDQYLKIFYQILEEEQKQIEFFGSAHEFIGFISWPEEMRWIKRRMKKGVLIKTLLLPGAMTKIIQEEDNKFMRETRIIEGASPFVSSFQLFANKVVIWQPKTPLAVLVEDEYIVAMLRSMFYYIWERTPTAETKIPLK